MEVGHSTPFAKMLITQKVTEGSWKKKSWKETNICSYLSNLNISIKHKIDKMAETWKWSIFHPQHIFFSYRAIMSIFFRFLLGDGTSYIYFMKLRAVIFQNMSQTLIYMEFYPIKWFFEKKRAIPPHMAIPPLLTIFMIFLLMLISWVILLINI